jgi:hypothetical protein
VRNHQNLSTAMWLRILREGKRLTAPDLAAMCDGSRDRADKLLQHMARQGQVKKYRSGHRLNGAAYGVDVECEIPPGVQLSQVLDAPRPKEPMRPSAIGRVPSVWGLGA